jgi:hypothetical protein
MRGNAGTSAFNMAHLVPGERPEAAMQRTSRTEPKPQDVCVCVCVLSGALNCQHCTQGCPKNNPRNLCPLLKE